MVALVCMCVCVCMCVNVCACADICFHELLCLCSFQWDLVCKRDFLVELSMTIFMVGAMVGAMVILPLSDRFGRKRVMLGCLFCQACVGTATAFVESYTLFTIFRFIIGMLNIVSSS